MVLARGVAATGRVGALLLCLIRARRQTTGGQPNLIPVCCFLFYNAVMFPNFPTFQVVPFGRIDPDLGVSLWVVDRHGNLQGIPIYPAVALGKVHRVAMWIAIKIEPGNVVEP